MIAPAVLISALLAGAAMSVGHLIRWKSFLHDEDGHPRGLSRLEAYVWGTGGILLSASIAVLIFLPEMWPALLIVWSAAASAGLTTIALWKVDTSNERIRRLQNTIAIAKADADIRQD